jgi:hypothetical protein
VLAVCAAMAAAIALLVIGLRRPSHPSRDHRAQVFARAVTRRPAVPAISHGGHRAVLVRGGDSEPAVSDAALVRHLEGLGFDVVQVLDAELVADDARAAELVVISASTLGKVVRERLPAAGLREAAVPIVTCESATFDLLGMTAQRAGDGVAERNGFGSARGHDAVEIVSPGHALAAGLSGPVSVARAKVAMSWGEPSSDAIRVATLDTNQQLVVQFAYERGSAMAGLRAPARRVGCFISADAAEFLTTEGWALFDAGVRWAGGL